MIAFYLPGEVPVYAFALILGAGATLGLSWVAWRNPKTRLSTVEAGTVALTAALVGARLVYAGAHWSLFRAAPLHVAQLYRGGLSWPGAAVGAVLGLALYARLARHPVLPLLDALLPLAAVITVSVWLGCWLDGCAYGPIAPNDWWGIPTRDRWGEISLRWPLQLIGALLALALFWALDVRRRRFDRPGVRAALGYSILLVQIGVLSLFRDDPAIRWAGLRVDTWAAGALAVLSWAGLTWTRRRDPSDEPTHAPTFKAHPPA